MSFPLDNTVNDLRNFGFDFAAIMETGQDRRADLDLFRHLCCRQNVGNLRWINRRDHVAVNDLQFSTSGPVRDCCYLSLDNFAAVEADPDAGAYAVIHIVIILASYPPQARPE